MNSPTPASGGDTRFSSDFLSHDGFPSILWEVLNSAGYPTPPLYTVQLYEEHRVPCCRVWLTLEVAFHFINLKKSPVAGFFNRSNE